jgi:hypothetical protein
MKYFSVEQLSRIKSSWELDNHVLAKSIIIGESFEDIQAGDIVFLSFSDKAGELVRHKLYGFSSDLTIRILDFGTYRNNDLKFICSFIAKVWQKKAYCMILSENLDAGLYHSLHEFFKKEIQHSASVCRTVRDIARLYPEQSFVSMACQQHRTTPFHLIKSKNLKILRLGEMRDFFPESEPYLRHASCCFFDLQAVRAADASAQQDPSTSGLTSEESCQLARYAGNAGRNKLFWIYGYDPDKDDQKLTSDLISQMIWYYAEGLENRKDHYPPNLKTLQSYVIEFQDLEVPLAFYKSPYSEKWWVGKSSTPEDLVPCSFRDYDKARNGELSDRLIHLLSLYQ